MTPANTFSQTYYTEKQYQAGPNSNVEATEAKIQSGLIQKMEAGINWFSRNLTGQYQPPAE